MKVTFKLNHGGCPIAQIQLKKNIRENYIYEKKGPSPP